MRSSVSVILSSAPPDTTMSFPDYLQTAADHSTLLILVRHLGQQLKPKAFNRLFETIQRLREIKVTDHQGNLRILHFRYKRSYPVENNEWGDFQTHRRVLGLLSVGKCTTREELTEIGQQHESLKVRYSSSLYDSRLIIFGSDALDDEDRKEENGSNFKSARLLYQSPESCESLVRDVTDFISSLFWVLESKRVSFIQGQEKAQAAEKLAALASGSGALNSVGSQLICAPFERKDFIGIDMDSRSNKKRCLGRAKKQQGDLCLQSGLPFDAILHYTAAAELLRGANDWLWLGGALEGLGAAAGTLHYPTLGRYSNQSLHRNSSFNIGDQGLPSKHLQAISEIGYSSRNDHLPGQPASTSVPTPDEIIDLYKEAIIHYSKYYPGSRNHSFFEQVLDIFVLSWNFLDIRGIVHGWKSRAVYSVDISSGTCGVLISTYSSNILQQYRHAGIIETEASLKAVHILIQQDKPIIAAEFLQNVVFINLQLPEEEKIQRFVTLAGLYEDIGFRRKAAFYRRVAAMRCVSPQNVAPSWSDCYQLLVQCLDGYKLSLDPNTSGPQINPAAHSNVWIERNYPSCLGWPHLQTRVLEELIGSARRMGNNALAIRHMIFLLHVMLDHSTLKELNDHANQLHGLTSVEGSPPSGILPVPLALESGVIIPPVHMTNLPRVKQFDLSPPSATLAVSKSREMKAKAREKLKGKGEDDDSDEEYLSKPSPFIVSSLRLSNGSLSKGKNSRHSVKSDNFWVVDEKISVVMEIENPLPMDLKISRLALMTEGVEFESEALDVVIGPLTSLSLMLHGTPRSHGKLKILGYSLTTLGVTSYCKLRSMRPAIGGPDRPFLEVEVVPALPILEVSASQSGSGADDVSCYPESLESSSPIARALKINMYAGERQEVKLKLKNVSKMPIDAIRSTLEPPHGPLLSSSSGYRNFLSWGDAGVVDGRLPLAPDDSFDVVLSLDATSANFIGPPLTGDNLSSYSIPSETGSAPSSLVVPAWNSPMKSRGGSVADGHSFLDPLGISSHSTGYRSLVSHQSFKSTSSLKSDDCLQSSNLSGKSKVISVVLTLSYSGGPGFHDGYCRRWSIAISLHIFPSVCVTGWDVLPGNTSQSCYLVLDVQNATNQEMELTYKAPTDKCIAIEPLDSCRIPIPIGRCPLTKASPDGDEPPSSRSTEEEDASIAKIVSDHVTSQVELAWVLPFSDMRGKANLHGIALSPSMVSLVRMPPVTWRVRINGATGENGKMEEVPVSLGSMVDVLVELGNSMLGRSLVNLTMEVRPFVPSQSSASIAFDSSLAAPAVAIVGSEAAFIPEVPVGGIFSHRMGLVFCSPGTYKVSIKCRAQSKETSVFMKTSPCPVWEHIPAVEINVEQEIPA